MHVSGAAHVAFTVTDLERSVRWYHDVFGADVVMDEPGEERSAAVLQFPDTNFFVGLCEYADGPDDPFDPTRLGLDHFAFSVGSREELDRLAARFDELGIDHSGAIDVPPGAILNFKDPDGLALALMWRR